ncbi:MAG: hypothetical protein M1832_004195 [Thelocarpon impressellum]|nr:MAG: hypothetical protein M1832_004195 [Thelocarpon impressellum]
MDKMNNTAGSFALLGATVPRDAGVVKKLRAAGVIILGKANLSQWSNFRSQNFTNGWSAHGGQVIGAYYPQQDPRGSSSGSAVAADVGLALGSLATDTVGSLLSPSDMNNLVGIKPTVGLTSRSMVIPVSQRQDSVGPMARTVKDAAYILSAIAGKDEYDNYTSAIPYDPLPDYVKACVPSALRGARIGIPRNAMPADNYTGYILAAFEVAVKVIGDAGATIVDNANYSAYEEFHRRGNPQLVLAGDFASDLPERYLSKLVTNPSNVSSLADVAAFTKAERREEYPERDTANWDRALRAGINNTAPEFWAAYQDNLRFGGAGGVLGALERDNLDVLLLPTYASPELPALVGYPVVTVPLGFHGPDQPVVKSTPRLELVVTAPNIPFGISFLGRPWSEEKLISYAYAFEQLTQARNKAPPHVVSPTGLADMSGIS